MLVGLISECFRDSFLVSFWLVSNDRNRRRCPPNDRLSYASQEQPGEPSSSSTSDNNVIDIVSGSIRDDRSGRVSRLDDGVQNSSFQHIVVFNTLLYLPTKLLGVIHRPIVRLRIEISAIDVRVDSFGTDNVVDILPALKREDSRALGYYGLQSTTWSRGKNPRGKSYR